MFHRLSCLAVVFLLTAIYILPSVFGQSATATFSGTVTDEKGAVVPGASVTVINSATGLQRETTTNGEGYFVVPLLSPGTYKVRVEHAGFVVIEVPSVILNVGDERSLRIELKVGDVKETVVVTNEAPLINESPGVGTVVDRQFVENIPLNGRSLQSLIALTPGAVAVPGGALGQQGEFSVNGQRTESNYYTVDGVAANTGSVSLPQAFGASGAVPGETALGTTQSLVSLDALQEFRIQTSTYSAEYGRTPGAQISFVTRSGTNQWHGSAFEYLRNDVFDASNWFNNASRLPKSKERQNNFGATFGGPIVVPHLYDGHNRTFFFFSYEGNRLSTPRPAQTQFVPDLAMRQTAPAALRPLLNAFPVPNGPENGATGMAQFTTAFSTPATLDATSVRIDHSLNSKFTIFGTYSETPSQALNRSGGALALSNTTTTLSSIRKLTFGSTGLFNSRLTNELRANFTRNETKSVNALDNLGGAVPFGLADVKDLNGQPTPLLDNLQLGLNFGGTSIYAIARTSAPQHQLNLVDTVLYSLGSHTLKFGIDYRRLVTPINQLGHVEVGNFTSKTQVQQNLVDPSSSTQSFHSFPFGPIYKNLSLFLQDDWKVTSRLSLSLGLRWEVNPPPTDAYRNPPYTLDQIANLATSQLAPKGTPLWKTTYDNFAPRIGAAYHLRQSAGRELVIRGGFGVFYDLGNTFASQGYSAVGFSSRVAQSSVPFPFTNTQLMTPPPSVAPPYSSVFAFDPHLQLPYTLEWNGAIEQALGRYQVLTVSYIGAAGRRFLVTRQYRPASIGNLNFTSTGSLFLTTNEPTSDYDALQIELQRRLSNGLQALASYTWSHSIDEASINMFTRQLQRASSNFDIRHNFQAAMTYDIPGKYDNAFASAVLRHWSLNTRFTARSALPFDVSGGTFIDSSGNIQQLRADLVPGQPIYISDASAPGGRRINFSAFSIPTIAERQAGQYGNAPRNFLRGFGAWQLDFGMKREFPIHERLKLEFRAEAFNIFNHPIFGAITNTLTSGSSLFGRATGSLNNQLGGLNALYQQGGPRSFQFALRLKF